LTPPSSFAALLFSFSLSSSYTNASHLSELNATIGPQRKELRNLRKKNAKRVRGMLIQDKSGNSTTANDYATLEAAQKHEILKKLQQYGMFGGEM